jgi:polyisoprenyl-teichoic acid--peptidoglycan teichoic acid transferase
MTDDAPVTATRPRRARRARRARCRLAVLGLLLAVTALVVPDATVRGASVVLVKVDKAEGIDGPDDVIWILALGSDARQGEPALQTRADAIQMIGVNLRTGVGSVIGIPRDSWVDIPGYGSDRINAAMYFGGPDLMAETVGNLVGVRPDYVFTTTFVGFKAMIQALGGVTVDSDMAFTDDNMVGDIHEGKNRLDPVGALFFGRARHYLPNGDFDRSAHQQELLRGILREIRAHADEPGFMERGALSVMKNLYTNLSPTELYRLGQAATGIDPAKLEGCVVQGSYGTVNGASIVFPDQAQAARLGAEAADDATFDTGC